MQRAPYLKITVVAFRGNVKCIQKFSAFWKHSQRSGKSCIRWWHEETLLAGYLKVKQSWTIANKIETSLWMRFNEKWFWFWPISQTWGRFCVEFLWPALKYLSGHLSSPCLASHCRHFKWKYNFCRIFANVCKGWCPSRDSCKDADIRLQSVSPI